jgi:protein-S-isoprenylcysteine O-methyltransferase Ste14
MLSYVLALTILTSAVALLFARWEYHKRGRLTLVGLFLLCVMIFMPNLVLEYATSYEIPSSIVDYIGIFMSILGIIICLVGIIQFGSIPKMMCQDAGELTISGIYRWSRNPQYVGWLLFLFGFALTDWSLWCLAALLVVAVSLHLLVLVEEEHLRRVFGEQYTNFCQRVPRYGGWGPVQDLA